MSAISRLLLDRERLGSTRSTTAALYGAKEWVERMDITNELYGHHGCVNALAWSHNGSLLASGSDDTHINIHTTTPTFTLNTTIATGHRANIFSVKFMPYSSSRTVISAAGDHQIRIFDVEYAPTVKSVDRSHMFSRHPTALSERGVDSRTKVFRSHRDRAKRLVTEDSPYLFLSCSEDGDVREFDLRKPSSFYCRVRQEDLDEMSPQERRREGMRDMPLIAYSRYRVPLNTISCSWAQPYYIAVGGDHRYGFLHDRRMLGRDRAAEAGQPGSRADLEGDKNPTRCVRRFKPRDRGNDTATHITACQISDENPNEVLFSWSGDNVYLFDINNSPEDTKIDTTQHAKAPRHNGRSTTARPRKRRRTETRSTDSEVMGSGPMRNLSIATHFVTLRRETFNPEPPPETEDEYKESYTQAICTAKVLLDRMKRFAARLERIDGSYESNSPDAESLKAARKENREKAMGFVQGAGALSQALGGGIVSESDTPINCTDFDVVTTGLDANGKCIDWEQQPFHTLFLQLILCFASSGPEAVRDFVWKTYSSDPTPPEEASPTLKMEFLDSHLNQLLFKASTLPLRRVGGMGAELFHTHKIAVETFQRVLSSVETSPDMFTWELRKFWGGDVAKSILMEAYEGVNHAFVDGAFRSGFGRVEELSERDEEEEERVIGEMERGERSSEEMEEGDDGSGVPFPMRGRTPAWVRESEDEDEEEEEEDDEEEDDDDGDESEGDHSDESDSEADFDDDGESTPFSFSARPRIPFNRLESHAPLQGHTKMYTGHCNVRTVKDVSFYGLRNEYVVSGCDSGHIFIWDRVSGQLVQLLKGDEDTVNVIQGHPNRPMMAVSGIDYTVKIFSPEQKEQKMYREYVLGERGAAGDGVEVPEMGEEDREGISMRRMAQAYQIMSSNEQLRDAAEDETVLTGHVLRMLAARMRQRATEGGEARIAIGGDNCVQM